MRIRSRPLVQRGEALAVLRRNPAFARVYLAQLVSFAGDWFATVAVLGLVLELTGRPALAGLVVATQILPTAVVSPLAGVVVDRFDRRALMIATDVARAVLALGLLFARTESTLWIAFVCMALMAALAAFFDPASSAAIPNLVAARDLPMANVLMGSTWGTMLAVGAALGGAVAATFGRDAAFIGNAASFALSGMILVSVRARFQAEREHPPGRITVGRDIVEMVRFARAERKVGSLLIVKAGFGLAGGVIGLIAVMATEVYGSDDTGIGILMSARGAGALTGPFLFRSIFGTTDRSLFRAIAVAFVVFAGGYALMGVSPTLWLASVGALVAHIGGGAQWTMSSIGLQRYTHDAIRGRIFSADYMLISVTIGVSAIVAGALADRFGPRPILLALSAVGLAWAALWTAITRPNWPARGSTPSEQAARIEP